MKKRTWFWLPRILTIVFILFISLFALDVFGNDLGFWRTLLALVIHLIPSIILALILIFAWNHGRVLGWMWVAFGIWYILIMIPNMIRDFQFYYLSWILEFSGAAFIMAALFFGAAKRK